MKLTEKYNKIFEKAEELGFELKGRNGNRGAYKGIEVIYCSFALGEDGDVSIIGKSDAIVYLQIYTTKQWKGISIAAKRLAKISFRNRIKVSNTIINGLV